MKTIFSATRRDERAFLVLALLTAVIITGCHRKGPAFNPHMPAGAVEGATVTNTLSVDLLTPSPEPFRLGPGDRLKIERLGDNTTKTTTAVGPDGKIYFHYLPGLDVWGLTVA